MQKSYRIGVVGSYRERAAIEENMLATRETPSPPIKSLQAFEATVRLGSMTAAARELGRTQPAISQQIRVLEEILGGSILERGTNSLRPTEEGMKFYQDISPLLAALGNAVQRIQRGLSRSTPVITIAANFGFTHLWLLPRLPELQVAFPGVRFTLVPADHYGSDASREADIYITFDRRNPNAKDEILLVQEVVFPVCSPSFAAAHGLGETLGRDDLEGCALLHMDEQNPRWLDWSNWAIHAGYGPLHESSSFTFNNYPLLINAALQGQGLTLAWGALVDTAIEQGSLVAMRPAVVRPDYGYLLRSRSAKTALVRPVIEWFQRSLATDLT